MDKLAIEIVIISAQDLKCVTSFGRQMRSYAVVWSDSATELKCTRTDREGGSYPTWNDKFRTTVSKSYLQQKGSSLWVQIYCKNMMGRKMRVGSARVPYADVLEGFAKPDSIHFLSYRIRSPGGRPRGTLDLSLRFLDKTDAFLPSSRPQFQMKFPAFPFQNSTNASNGYQRQGRLIRPFNLQESAARHNVPTSTNTSNGYHSQFATYL